MNTPLTDTPARFAAALRKLSACEPARTWAKGLNYATAWATCTNPDWLLWLLTAKEAVSPITNELLICAFAREVVHLNPDPRVLACIEVREAWAAGNASDESRAAAVAAARDAARAAAGAAAGDAAVAAARDAARAAAGAAAWDAAWAAAWDAAWAAAGARQCEIIRQICPMPTLF